MYRLFPLPGASGAARRGRSAAPRGSRRPLAEPLESRTLFAASPGFTETEVVAGLNRPTAMQRAADGRFFITEQGGAVRIIKDGALLREPALQLQVDSSGERGLLGLAFDPNFRANGYLYLYRTVLTPAAHNIVSRFTVVGDSVAPGGELVLLDLPDLGA